MPANKKANDLNSLWDKYADLLWEEGKHKEACGAYISEIHHFMAKYGCTKYDNILLDGLTKHFRKKGNRNATINRKFASLSKILRKHRSVGGLDILPDFSKLPERNARVRFLSHQEERQMLRLLESHHDKYAQLSRFLAETGARVGEALNLKWADIDDNYITFWETKSYRPRSVPISERAGRVIAKQRKFCGQRAGPFRTVRYFRYRLCWNAAKDATDMRDDRQVVPHVLRHTCASRLAQAGVDIKRIQEFLGHRTLTMTLRYAHLSPRHLDVCADALNSMNRSEH